MLQDRLGLSDEELLAALDADALSVLSGDLDHKPQLPILLTLTEDLDAAVLRRWLRAAGPHGRPVDLLLAHDYAAFEDAVEDFRERGFVLGRRPS